MNKILSAALLVGCLTASVQAQNLVVNGSFEANTNGTSVASGASFANVTAYTDWRVFNVDPTDVTNFSTTIIPNASAGSHAISLNIGKTAGGGGSYGLDRANALVPVTVGTNYVFSFDAAWIAGATASNLGFCISEFNGAGVFTGSQTVFPNFTVSAASYQTFTVTWSPANTNTTQINIAFAPLYGVAGATTLSIDNVQIATNTDITTPAIINTLYGTEDVVIADYVATNLRYGADPAGVKDSTVAIQNALNDCYNSGGGTVYLPAGTYLVTNTLYVPSFVTLRGDWRDADSGSGSYGTVIQAALAAGDTNGPVLFQIGGSAGVMGLTTFYPNQNASSPVAYNYTFCIPSSSWTGEPGIYMSSSIINCTLLNSYRGIGINALDITQVHELSTVKNVKGTVLYRGLVAYNSADVDTNEHVTFNNSYWANAGAVYNAPSLATLNTWTRANGIAFTLGDLEWAQFYALSCSDYLYGINTVAGSRISFCGEFLWANITNTTIAVKVDNIDTRWGMSFLRSVLNGSSYSIQNNTAGYVHVCDSTVTGTTGGSGITVTAPGTSPTSYTETTCPKVSRTVLYNVTTAPYNAPYSLPQTGLPAADATAAIQSALTAAGNAGGGVVYLPAGWYRINSDLTVPANVELRGSSSVPERDQSDSSLGTVLLGYEGAGSATPNTDTALVTLNGANAGIRGIRFFYPNNNPAGGTVTTYPYCIRGNGASQYVVNIALTGVYNGVDFAANRCDNHVIRKVRGVAYLHFICVGTSTQGWVEGCSSNGNAVDRCNFGIPGWITEANIFTAVINPITRLNEILILINSASSENVLNNFAYGASIGVNTASCNVNIFNLGTDNLGTGSSGGYSAGGSNTTINLLNVMKYLGNYYSHSGTGTITTYNPMTL